MRVRVTAFNLCGFRQLFVAAVMVCMIFGIIREIIAAVIDVATLVVVVVFESACVVFDRNGGVNACAGRNNASFVLWVYVVVLNRDDNVKACVRRNMFVLKGGFVVFDHDGGALTIGWFGIGVRVIESVM